MPGVEINWWAILAAAVFNVAAGSIWFTAAGRSSRKLTAKKASRMTSGDPAVWFIFACSVVQAWILVHFVRYAGSLTFWQGAVTGFWLWLGLIAITVLVQHLFEDRGRRPWQSGIVYFLIVLVVDSGLLAAWR
jgi:hypothetical protein